MHIGVCVSVCLYVLIEIPDLWRWFWQAPEHCRLASLSQPQWATAGGQDRLSFT